MAIFEELHFRPPLPHTAHDSVLEFHRQPPLLGKMTPTREISLAGSFLCISPQVPEKNLVCCQLPAGGFRNGTSGVLARPSPALREMAHRNPETRRIFE